MSLRLELFVTDLLQSVDFYRRVLRFEVSGQPSEGYTPVTNGSVLLGLNLHSNLSPSHPLRAVSAERLGRGIEIVLEVDDIEEMYAHVTAQGWPLARELVHRPWGLTDFRLLDPDGYYLRLTSRTASS